MGPLDHCVYEPVEVTRRNGRSMRKAYRYGLLAVHRSVNERRGWVITHLPTGLVLTGATGLFLKPEAAAAAMIEISGLRNDWLNLGSDPLPDLAQAVRAAGVKHGGRLDLIVYPGFKGRDYKANSGLCERFV